MNTANTPPASTPPETERDPQAMYMEFLEAVIKAARAGHNGGLTPAPAKELTPEGRDALFGFEVLSALMGRGGSERAPFLDRLAEITREPGGRLIVNKPKRLGRNPVADVTSATGKKESLRFTGGVVTLESILDTEVIEQVVIRDLEGRPVAVTGRIGAVSRPVPQ